MAMGEPYIRSGRGRLDLRLGGEQAVPKQWGEKYQLEALHQIWAPLSSDIPADNTRSQFLNMTFSTSSTE